LRCLEAAPPPDILFAATLLGDLCGAESVRRAKRLRPDLHAVFMARGGRVGHVGEDLKAGGADDFLLTPIRREQLCVVLQKVLERERPSVRRGHVGRDPCSVPGLVGTSSVMQEVYRTVRRVGPSEETVLITGESGTGKELAARAVHFWSRRHGAPFVTVNCPSLTDTILENELFGHEPQSFTGATGRTVGLIEQANGGTLFLDEIGDASPALQTSLLRVLQEREIRRVGSTESIPIDVRVVAATNRRLEQAVREGAFRRDLYYRLHVLPIAMPALRERGEDIPLLADHFLDLAGAANRSFGDAAMHALQRHPWPGNVRELQNLVRRLCVLVLEDAMRLEHLPPRYRECGGDGPVAAGSFHQAKQNFERRYLEALLRRVEGNVSEAARRAGIGRAYLHTKLRKFGIDPNLFRQGQVAAF
jgi:DNA-binding NtrC family response regulator